jgi:hypothetical protein
MAEFFMLHLFGFGYPLFSKEPTNQKKVPDLTFTIQFIVTFVLSISMLVATGTYQAKWPHTTLSVEFKLPHVIVIVI